MARAAIELAQHVGDSLKQRQWTLATAESCTGGLIGHLLTDIAGSSAYYIGGIIAYSDEVKHHLLGVPRAILAAHGAVSEATARAMAEGVRERLQTPVGIATTGIAGPGGGTPQKPVGLVYICAATPIATRCERYLFTGDREANKQATAQAAFKLVLELLNT